MTVSEAEPAHSRGERRSYLVLAAAALIALVAVAFSGPAVMPVLVAAAMGIAALALYLAAPRRAAAGAGEAAALSQQAAQLPDSVHEILEYVDDPFLILDRAGRVLFANRASQVVIGAQAEQKRISAVLRTPQVLEAIERVTAGGEPEKVAFNMPVPVQRYFEAAIARNQSALVLIHIRDLTAMRRAEELRADFVANASHELRTPLAAVSGFIDTLRGHAKDDKEARERFLEIMSAEAGRMRRLIEDLLSLTRIELNEHNPPSGEVDVASLVREAAAALAPLADAERVRIAIASDGRLPVIGDRDELTQVFQNLIHNAIKYGREGGEVRVRFGRAPAPFKGEEVFVSVEDEGEGIPREAIPRLTERFYRVDVKRSRQRGGTGLGLAIVKHILNRHQGRLQIESTPGTGSIFTVSLPAAAQPPGKETGS